MIEDCAMPAWCCLCGQRHDMGTHCDPVRIVELRKQADLVRRLAFNQRGRQEDAERMKPSTKRDKLT